MLHHFSIPQNGKVGYVLSGVIMTVPGSSELLNEHLIRRPIMSSLAKSDTDLSWRLVPTFFAVGFYVVANIKSSGYSWLRKISDAYNIRSQHSGAPF
jgi:hypothetical protein